MAKKEVLLEVIDYLFAFDAEINGSFEYTIQDFATYLYTQVQPAANSLRKIEGDKEQWIGSEHRDVNSDIAILFVLLNRYAKVYFKKGLKDSLIQTQDEFSFLITIMTFESLTKTELITKQIMEKTSGTEVIKRLLNLQLLHEFADSKDKRSVRVAISEKGRLEIIQILPQMGLVSKVIVGNLNEQEKNMLLYLLKKLDFFHNDIYMNKKQANLNELL